MTGSDKEQVLVET